MHLDSTHAVGAVIAVVVSIGATGFGLVLRRHGVKNWWGYLLSVPFLLIWAAAMVFGPQSSGRTG